MELRPIPPGPKYNQFSNFIFAFQPNPLSFLSRLASQYGDIVYFKLGKKHLYLLNHPDFIHEVLVNQSQKFSERPIDSKTTLLPGNSLLQLDDNPPNDSRYLKAISCAVEKLSQRWERSKSRSLDILFEMKRLSLMITIQALLGIDLESKNSDLVAIDKILGKLLMDFDRPASFPLRTVSSISSLAAWPSQKSIKTAGQIAAQLVAASPKRLAALARQQVQNDVVKSFSTSYLTIALPLTWTWYLLSQHPGEEARLHAELECIIDNQPPANSDLNSLPFTQMVLAETLRLYPPVWAIKRSILQECILSNYTLPAGSEVLMSQWLIHRDPRYYPVPNRYDPGRWAIKLPEPLRSYAYFPYKGGLAACIGEECAWTGGILALASLAQRWRLRLAQGRAIKITAGFTLQPQEGLWMNLEARKI